jgi:hypothetical protein
MGIFDRFRHHKDDAGGTGTALKDRAAGMMSGHGEQAGQGLDRAGKMIDDKTGGKYSDQINTGVGRAKDTLGQKTEQDSGAMDETTPNMPQTDMGTQGGEGTEQPPQG